MSDPFGYHSGQYVHNFSESENKEFTATFSQITEGFKLAMEQGLEADHESVQELVCQHFEFCLQFWKPDRESYKSLAMSYILPSPYQESYESVAKGLGQYHYDAIVIFADKNL
jgi:hypothetical protein